MNYCIFDLALLDLEVAVAKNVSVLLVGPMVRDENYVGGWTDGEE